jgi:hypothetical protein
LPRKSPTDAIQDGSLHEGRLDLVVYYIRVDGDFLVVIAIFASKGGGDPPGVVMGLADRDSVAFPCWATRTRSMHSRGPASKVTVSTEIDMHLRPDAPMH